MSHESNEREADDLHEVEVPDRTYLKVFLALLMFTVLEYVYARFTQDHFAALLLGLVSLAVTKAALVAIFFMHLKFEGRWVYLLLIPTGVLATALVLALYPDIAYHPDETTPPRKEGKQVVGSALPEGHAAMELAARPHPNRNWLVP